MTETDRLVEGDDEAVAQVLATITHFRQTAERCWAQQDRRRPVLSLIRRMRARQAERFADRLIKAMRAPRS